MITVRLKLYSGLDKELDLADYDRAQGLFLSIPSGKRLKWALRLIGMKELSSCSFFRSGERITPGSRLDDGDEISCLKPSGGG